MTLSIRVVGRKEIRLFCTLYVDEVHKPVLGRISFVMILFMIYFSAKNKL